MSDKIDCRTSELLMNSFLDKDLVGEDLWDFLNHVLSCDACYEELETRYLLNEALTRLENGETIDLEREIKQRVNNSRRSLRFHRFGDAIYRTIEIIAGIVVAFSVSGFFTLFFNR